MATKKSSTLDRIVDRYMTKVGFEVESMSRGVLVVDENVSGLAVALMGRGIRVIIPSSGTPDDKIKSDLLPKRIIVTQNTKDFIADASSFEYGIISLDKLSFIDSERDPAKNTTAKIISDAIVKYKIWSKTHGFILVLVDNGKHRFELLTT